MSDLLPYFAALASIGTLFWGIWQHYDVKRREERRLRFEQFRMLLIWVSGRDEQGRALIDRQQLTAIYQLKEYPELSSIWVPVLRYLRDISLVGDDHRLREFKKAIDEVLAMAEPRRW